MSLNFVSAVARVAARPLLPAIFMMLAASIGLPAHAGPGKAAANRPASSRILSAEVARSIAGQCSRDAPRAIEGVWLPSKTDIERMEQHMDQLMKLESGQCCGRGRIEGALGDYYVEYAGVVISGHRLIYISAGPAGIRSDLGDSPKGRQAGPMRVCDGGKRFWGALYDPETQTFRDLAFNGVA